MASRPVGDIALSRPCRINERCPSDQRTFQCSLNIDL